MTRRSTKARKTSGARCLQRGHRIVPQRGLRVRTAEPRVGAGKPAREILMVASVGRFGDHRAHFWAQCTFCVEGASKAGCSAAVRQAAVRTPDASESPVSRLLLIDEYIDALEDTR